MSSALLLYVTLQPWLPECEGDARGTARYTFDERRALADMSGQGLLGFIPVCIDHAGGDEEEYLSTDRNKEFKVPNGLQVGRVVFMFVNGDKQLSSILEVFHEQTGLNNLLVTDILTKRRRWGVSLSSNMHIAPDRFEIIAKTISHIGLTTNPEHGRAKNGASWIHIAALNPEAFYTQFNEQVLSKDPHMYMHPSVRERLRALIPATPVGRPLARPMITNDNKVPLPQSGTAGHLAQAQPGTVPVSLSPPAHRASPTPMSAPPVVPAPEQAANPPVQQPQQQVVPPPQQPQPQQQQVTSVTDFQPWLENFKQFMQKSITTENNTTQPLYTSDLYRDGSRLMQQLQQLYATTKMAPNELPRDLIRAQVALDGYLEATKNLLNKEIDVTVPATNDESRRMSEIMREAVNDPFHPTYKDRNLPLVEAVFANHSRRLHNETEWNTKFSTQFAKQKELEIKLKELEDEKAALKRDRDTFEANVQNLTKSLEEANKKARVDNVPQQQQPQVPINSVVGATAAGLSSTVAPVGATAGGSSLPSGYRYVQLEQPFGGVNLSASSKSMVKDNERMLVKQQVDYWVKQSEKAILGNLK